MKKFVVSLALAIASVGMAFAAEATNSIDVSNLSAEQIAQLKSQADALKAQPAAQVQAVSAAVREEATAWGELGVNMGRAMVGAAKEVGVAANEFASTDLGQIVTFMVVYKYVGQEMLSIFIGTFVLVGGLFLSIWVARSDVFCDVKYEYKPFLWGMWSRKVLVEKNHTEDALFTKLIGSAILLVMSLVVGLATIF